MNLNSLMDTPSIPHTSEVLSQPPPQPQQQQLQTVTKAFSFSDILSGDGPSSFQEAQTLVEPKPPAIEMPQNQIYHIPIDQTPLQKELISIILDLHKSNFLKQLKKYQNSVENDLDMADIKNEEDYETLSDESMIELFIQNIENISIHNSLLVSHYIPSKVLQMMTKKITTVGSSKFQVLDRILNSMTENPTNSESVGNNKPSKKTVTSSSSTEIQTPKKIFITAANSKELDLIESLLLGKKYQYYRFSGSSIYYENHGTFNYNYQAQVESLSEETGKNVKGKKRAYNKKNKSDGTSTNGSNSNSNTGSSGKREYKKKNTGTNTPTKSEKKSGGAPSSSSTASGQLTSNNSNNNNNNNQQQQQQPQQSARVRRKRAKDEDYYSPFSKNNPVSIETNDPSNPHRFNHNIQICLILSNQIKNLLHNNKEYRADLVLSLDSNISEIQAYYDNQWVFVPILKFVPLNSTEHIILKINEYMKTQASNVIIDSEFLSKQRELIAYLTIINLFDNENEIKPENIKADDDANDKKLNDLMKWIENPTKVQFPYSLELKDVNSMQLDKEEIVKKSFTLLSTREYKPNELYKTSKYEFFKTDSSIDERKFKKNKISSLEKEEVEFKIEDKMSLSTYRSKLAILFDSRFKYLQSLNERAKEELNNIHSDESKRQNYLESKTEEIKQNFTKLQKDKVSANNITRQVEKNESDLGKLKDSIEILEKRELLFKEKKNEKDDDENKDKLPEILKDQEDEIEKLTKELETLELEISEGTKEIEDVIRVDYQKKSNKAAELSLEMTNLGKLKESLTKEINGPSQELKNLLVKDELKELEISIKKFKNQNQFVELHLNKLKGLIKERSALYSNVLSGRSSRHSRSSTPY